MLDFPECTAKVLLSSPHPTLKKQKKKLNKGKAQLRSDVVLLRDELLLLTEAPGGTWRDAAAEHSG